MRPLIIVILQPYIHIHLQFLNGIVNLFTKSSSVKLFLHRSVKAFANTIGLRTLSFCFCVVNIFNSQIELIFVMFSCTTVFGSPIGKYSHKRDTVLVVHRDYPVIEHIGSHQSNFSVIKFNGSHLSIGINKCLLINTTHTFDITHIIGILSSKITGMIGLNFSF
ncbi:hypothetical protein SDC9_170056 [bioreactor metagenome]|uniref:Uncharacterized protein n=1 Tax=bioreactor metagenome TaxID=1076179 RepID=A0A645GFZ5_9ZZZZ